MANKRSRPGVERSEGVAELRCPVQQRGMIVLRGGGVVSRFVTSAEMYQRLFLSEPRFNKQIHLVVPSSPLEDTAGIALRRQ